jgi:ankyrin repeat protein
MKSETRALKDAVMRHDSDAALRALKAGATASVRVVNVPVLWTAALRGDKDVVRRLLDNGAAQDWRAWGDEYSPSITLLHLLAATGRSRAHVEIARMLIAAGADVNWRGKAGFFSPLETAAGFGNGPMTKLFIEHGAIALQLDKGVIQTVSTSAETSRGR